MAASRTVWLLSFLSLAVFVTIEAYIPFGKDYIVDTYYGRLKGFELEESYAFWGIPFARPPVGNLRFAEPQRPLGWTGTREATAHSPGCMQECHEPPVACPLEINEDCLYLDMWIPKSNRSEPYPVYIFIHGGNFRDGSGTALVYDGRFLAQESEAIIITINYRLEAFGWLFLGNMIDPATGTEMSLVNQGLKDQQMAFLYVKENIHLFGGDPKRVTISGQSAGAQSIGVHLLIDSSEALFDQAIQYSNPFTLAFKTKKDGVALAAEVAKLLDCDTYDLVCLRSKDANDLLAASRAAATKIVNPVELLQAFEPWGPGVGQETEVPEEIIPSFQNGMGQHKPTMLGTTREEGRLFIWLLFQNRLGNLGYRIFLRALLSDFYREIIQMYPTDNTIGADQREILAELTTDYIFHCINVNISQAVGNQGYLNYYHYVFNAVYENFPDAWGPDFEMCWGHVCHAGDLAYVFRTAPLGNYSHSPREIKMMDEMAAHLSNFLHTGNPNTPGSETLHEKHQALPGDKPYWPRIQEKANSYYTMYYNECGNSVLTNYRKKFCELWDAVDYYKVSPLNSIPEEDLQTIYAGL